VDTAAPLQEVVNRLDDEGLSVWIGEVLPYERAGSSVDSAGRSREARAARDAAGGSLTFRSRWTKVGVLPENLP